MSGKKKSQWTQIKGSLNRSADRIAAYSGMLEDAQPIFADCEHVEGAGSLLAIASRGRSRVF